MVGGQVSGLTRPWMEGGGSSRWKGGVCAQILTLAQQSCCPRRGDSDQPSDQLLAATPPTLKRETCAIVFNNTSWFVKSRCGKNKYLCNSATPCNVCAEMQKVTPTDTFLGKAMQRKDDFTFDHIVNVNTPKQFKVKHHVTLVNHFFSSNWTFLLIPTSRVACDYVRVVWRRKEETLSGRTT